MIRRRHRQYGSGAPSGINRISYEQVRAAEWMLRLLKEKNYVLDCNFFDYLDWLSGGLKTFLTDVICSVGEIPKSTGRDEALEALTEATGWSRERLKRGLDDIVNEYPCIVNDVCKSAAKLCEAVVNASACNAEERARARKQMKKVFGLGTLSLDFFEFVHFLDTNGRILGCYFEDSLDIWKTSNRDIMACALDTNRGNLEKTISELTSCGILDMKPGQSGSVEDDVVPIWEMPDTHDFSKLFCIPVKGETLPLEKFRIPEDDLRYVKKLLTSRGNIPVNIMLYGPPGTGKTTFARSLARELGLKAWSVSSRNNDDERFYKGRRAALTACLKLASRHKGSFVLVDEAEKMLDTGFAGRQDKGWLNSVLEKPGNRIIWITNYVHHINNAVRRRFSFSIYFQLPGQDERRSLWQEIIARQKTEKYFTKEQIESLAKNHEVPAAVIQDSIKRAKSMRCGNTEFVSNVECSLRAYETFLKDGVNDKRGKQIITEPKGFTPDGVTLESSLDDLLERCRRADTVMKKAKDTKEELEGGCATMLFYGPPGTGKTALARHIAYTLGRECIVKRASDLMSCLVGSTEKNIASAFCEAERKGAVLVIDEADTFIYSRGIAVRSWETSQVNEFLTSLEECRCFCICTTNRLDDLDAAALRRFSYKVEFTWAKPDQVMALYNTLLAPLCSDEMTPEIKGELRGFTHLTPGDFHAVRGQFNPFMSGETTATHGAMIAALRKEEQLKGKHTGRVPGF
ncbi:MAG: AAA family ATPase [Fretibacterium sp.]|nr:AAA family ATPase [Fretibacterium sp.]